MGGKVNMATSKLYAKILIEGKLKLLTGLHISGSNEFAAIGAVDAVVIREPYTYQPIIPGSSIKGKMRYLAARIDATNKVITDISEESEKIKRLFGSTKGESGIILSRLQYYDLKINEESLKKLKKLDLDLPYTEVKFENTITRTTGIATPRQLERVPAGTIFDFKLVYNVEDLKEVNTDLEFLKQIIGVLEHDYIGGHGTRGYGKVCFADISLSVKNYCDEDIKIKVEFDNEKVM